MTGSLGADLDERLAPGRVRVERDGRAVEVEVLEVERLGARVRRLRVEGAGPADPVAQAEALPERLQPLPDRVVPVEVDRGLGAVLRSRPARRGEYFEVRAEGAAVSVGRWRAGEAGREEVPFDLTREQLGRLVDDIADTLPGDAG